MKKNRSTFESSVNPRGLASIWADITYAQYRMDRLNRPWAKNDRNLSR